MGQTCYRRSAEVDTDRGAHAALETIQICAIHDTIAHIGEEAIEVGTAKVGAGAEFGQGIGVGADAVQHDVLSRVDVELLGEIGVDLEEFDARVAGDARGLVGLVLERGEERLEPFEGARVSAYPDEFDTAESAGRVGRVAQVPDVLEDRGPRSDADTSSDEDSDFVFKDILGGSTVRSIDAQSGHHVSVLEGDFVHAHGINLVVQLCLSSTSTERITELASKVTNLADVNGDVRVVRA